MKSSTTPLAWGGWSFLLGLLAAGGLTLASPIWLLAQLAGPISFLSLWLIMVFPALLGVVFVVKTRRLLAAVRLGFSFAVPITTFCIILPSTSQVIESEFGEEIRILGFVTIIVSILIMAGAALLRRLAEPAETGETGTV